MGVAPTTLDVALIQHKRWSEGLFQILFSKYCPFIYGHGKINLGAQMGYCILLFWAPMSFPALYYVIIPPLCLLRGISLFHQVYLFTFLFLYNRLIHSRPHKSKNSCISQYHTQNLKHVLCTFNGSLIIKHTKFCLNASLCLV